MLFPASCISCNATLLEGTGLCNNCWSDLKFISPPWCEKCGIPKPNSIFNKESCNGCIHRRKSYDKLRTGLMFEGPIKKLIHQFKYGDDTTLAPLLSRLSYRSAQDLSDADIVIPVPIHGSKLKKRKYNQAALLSKEISKMLDKECIVDFLERIKETKSQVGLSKMKRIRNVKKAFILNQKYKKHINGKKILLIDDVISTGSTADECSKCLKESGAASVYVLCVARNEVSSTP